MAAYKIAAEAGDALSQHQVGYTYCNGLGVAVDYEQARPWIEKAAAQDNPQAVGVLGVMYDDGLGVTPSWRRARELWERSIELGSSEAVENMQTLTQSIAQERVAESHLTPPPAPKDVRINTHFFHPMSSRRLLPSWTSGWRSTARAART